MNNMKYIQKNRNNERNSNKFNEGNKLIEAIRNEETLKEVILNSNYFIDSSISNTQLRKVYDKLKEIERKDKKNRELELALLIPRIEALSKRNNWKKEVKMFFERGIKEVINNSDYFNRFLNVVEAIIAYNKK